MVRHEVRDGFHRDRGEVQGRGRDLLPVLRRMASEVCGWRVRRGPGGHGTALREHLNEYYFKGISESDRFIDYVICSHPDQDHASSLREILDSFRVGELYMNRPWLYTDELYPMVLDGRITKESLKKRLRDSYPYIAELESLAEEKGIPIREGFQGTAVGDVLTILSPSKDFYLRLLAESSKTPIQEKENTDGFVASLAKMAKKTIESWLHELLREDVRTSAENESSIVMLGDMGDEKFLLTGDAGVRALECAADYAENNICDLKEVRVHQIPHHGGRHNVSPSILNRIVGNIIPKEISPEEIGDGKAAIVSVGVGSDHPRKMVTNAYIRRGAKVYEARGSTVCHFHGDMPERGAGRQ